MYTLVLLLQLLLQLLHSLAVQGAAGNAAVLESAAIEAGAVVIVTVTNDFSTSNDDRAVAVMEWRLRGLLEAESEVVVRLHFGWLVFSWVVSAGELCVEAAYVFKIGGWW